MSNNASSLDDKIKLLRLEGLRYCENADRNLKVALLQADQRLKEAQEEFVKREKQVATLSKQFGMMKVTRIVEIAKLVVDQKSVDMTELKLQEIDAMHQYVIPLVHQMKTVELREKEFNLVKDKIDVNAHVYGLYKKEIESHNAGQ
ncbi:hypothetical protein BBOV_III002895 [Babesia bovis T2Bo]|uniref:hypothetical protein n=1 Tax=Babesia bovis T2Bo TaxID=484906 RepID=UPI001C3661AA|nr:hypothetical protein BBOV_III002895 [Babesia bovis T2Bo]KAG6440059.1 hypothetical protein BBOV_III002895 [Babesia bovis T2Bo]